MVLVLTVLVILAMEWAGRVGSLWFIDKAFGDKAAERYDTRWTAVGVIHHEFSHLLVALITGARIDGVQLYNFRRKEGEAVLGYGRNERESEWTDYRACTEGFERT